MHGAPIYVRHEVVHNKFVVDDLRAKGAVFVEELERSAGRRHGRVQRARRVAGGAARRRGARAAVFDATCPLVTKVHVEVTKMREQGREIVMIGHAGHPEVEGTMGQSTGGMHLVETAEDVSAAAGARPETNLAYVTQTTLSVDDARGHRRGAEGALSRHRRAEEGRHLLRHAEPPGCGESSGARVRCGDRGGLAEQLELQSPARGGDNAGVAAYMVDTARDLDPRWLEGSRRIGITAGASAPEVLVQELLERLRALGATEVREMDGISEAVVFPLPKSLLV